MAAPGPFVFSQPTKLNFFNTTNLLNAAAANYRLALVTSAWVPAPATDQLYSVASANELATANGYTSGGLNPGSIVLSQTGGVVKFTGNAVVWTASGTGIPAWRYGVLYYLGTLNSLVNPLVGYFLGDATPADVPLTTSGNTLTITPSASGILTAT
jgi:hypothetical protein